jgi:type IV secretory pathway TrbF-like protein
MSNQVQEADPETLAVFRANKLHFDDWCGSERTQKTNWQRFAAASMVMNFVLTGAVVYFGTLPKRVLVPVVQDRATGTLSIGQPHAADSSSSREMTFSNFVSYWRVVTSDSRLQKIYWDSCYYFIGKESPANKFMDRWHSDQNPELRAKKELVSVKITATLPLSENSYQISWDETAMPLDGGPEQKSSWQAVLVYAITGQPKDPDAAAANPAGIFITEIHPTKVNSKESDQ